MNPMNRATPPSAISLLLIAGAALLANGCAFLMPPRQPYAKTVTKKPGESGAIRILASDQLEDRKRAEELMKENCGPKEIQVVNEEEVVTGTQTVGTENYQASSYGSSLSGEKRTRTMNSTEWQITYRCVQAANRSASAATKRRM